MQRRISVLASMLVSALFGTVSVLVSMSVPGPTLVMAPVVSGIIILI